MPISGEEEVEVRGGDKVARGVCQWKEEKTQIVTDLTDRPNPPPGILLPDDPCGRKTSLVPGARPGLRWPWPGRPAAEMPRPDWRRSRRLSWLPSAESGGPLCSGPAPRPARDSRGCCCRCCSHSVLHPRSILHILHLDCQTLHHLHLHCT